MELQTIRLLLGFVAFFLGTHQNEAAVPLVINTWNFLEANKQGSFY